MHRTLLALGLIALTGCSISPPPRPSKSGGEPKLGSAAPELLATTLDGQPFKLSDYKGKVVVLDIWATWCGPCRAMIPHEREMVKKLADKPFAFVSIAADDTADAVKSFVRENDMAWTHLQEAPGGSIHQAYGISFYPSIYVIDAKGVIRSKHVRGEQLDAAVAKLLKEAGA